jgi:hypothetical protein
VLWEQRKSNAKWLIATHEHFFSKVALAVPEQIMLVCRLQQLGSALSECSSLAELRVSHNALQSLPQELSRNKRLKIIEAGANQIDNFEEVQVST